MHIIGVILAQQYSVKKGTKLFGDEGRKAVSKELQQMHDMVAIEAHEGREIVTVDIPGAFLHTDTDEHIHMLLRGELAELMVRIDPKLYRPYITKNSIKGESILFVTMQKAIYGMLRASLLF